MLSVVILTFNSEKYLAEALKSCEFADEVVVVDSGSTDGTEQICAGFKNVKFYKEKWRGFSAQKQLGVDLARNRWVFVLDSDEVILEPLRDEILRVLERPEFCAYEVARANLFFGKEVRTMGLFPDYTIRLFDKTMAQFDGREIHEKVVLKNAASSQDQNRNGGAGTGTLTASEAENSEQNGAEGEICAENCAENDANSANLHSSQAEFDAPNETQNLIQNRANAAQTISSALTETQTEAQNAAQTPNLSPTEAKTPNPALKNQIGRLKNHFKHYAYDSIEQFIAKQNRYSSLGAKGAKTSKFKAVLNPAWTFFKLFFIKGGWREGWRGYVIARLYAQYTFWKYVK